MISNLLKRTITCILGIAVLFALIYFLPMHNFVGLSAVVIILSLAGSIEMSKIIFNKINILAYLSWVFVLLMYFGENYFVALLILAVCINIKSGEKDNFKNSISDTAKSVLLCIYPSFFLSYLIRFFALDNVNMLCIIFYLVLVFSNDIFAYIFGMLFGKNNKGIFKASPNKSIAGFAGGFASCIGICFLFTYLFRENLPFFSWDSKLIIAITISVFANLGDLAESVLKRSAGLKDSGKFFPGRGGVLDCIDSICTTAPLIFWFFKEIVK